MAATSVAHQDQNLLGRIEGGRRERQGIVNKDGMGVREGEGGEGKREAVAVEAGEAIEVIEEGLELRGGFEEEGREGREGGEGEGEEER